MHLYGDRNTRYFHKLAKIKSTTKTVSSLRIGDRIFTCQLEISDHIVQHFSNLYSSNTYFLYDISIAEEVIPRLVDDTMNNFTYFDSFCAENKRCYFLAQQGWCPWA